MLMFADVEFCVVENMIAELLLSVEQQLDNSILLFNGQIGFFWSKRGISLNISS